ncbi:hypothetical protein GCM10029976_052400 [Kribbella albertanoniae]|uniref:Uncharacterized protein n=1 Tax=Kribbella albertanoniae TaxID=1266829 RepID=A0A4R4Q5Q6_9ACTN|nr:hypothetical protein [Kribbella albertanoniae]TDC30454.1 hypothetical protein E1261_13290 [Kribbella albertanoniae]
MRTGELLIPVGHDLGVMWSGAGDERRQQVRIGTEVMELDDEDFVIWLLAHGVGDEDRPTRSSLLERATALGLPTATSEPALDRFLADGLLVRVDPEGDNALEFARNHQLFPLVQGLGPDPEQPWLQLVGILNHPMAQVSSALYDVWAWSQLAPELWTGCEDAAVVAQQVGVTNPGEIEPRQVLAGVLGQIHGLLCVRAAYFDRRRIR